MKRKLSFFSIVLALLAFTFSAVLPASAATQYAPENVQNLNTTGQPTTLYGQLLGIGNTTAPGSFNIRVDGTTDYVITFDQNTLFFGSDELKIGPDWFLPGDWIRVIGILNPDGLSVDADVVVNTSVRVVGTQNINGWIQSIDADNNRATLLWGGKTFRLDFIDQSRIIIPGRNANAEVSDLRVGDRVRGRGVKHASLNIIQVQLMVVLRRGAVEWVRNNTEVIRGPLLSIDTENIPSTAPSGTTAVLEVKDNKRNLTFTIYTTENTKYFRRYFGRSSQEELIPGDSLSIVGKRRSNDSPVLTAHVLRNNSIRMVTTKGIAGTIVAINLDDNNLILERLGVNWRIDFDEDTHIVLVTPTAITNPASLADLAVGDECRGRGIKHSNFRIIEAEQGVCWRT